MVVFIGVISVMSFCSSFSSSTSGQAERHASPMQAVAWCVNALYYPRLKDNCSTFPPQTHFTNLGQQFLQQWQQQHKIPIKVAKTAAPIEDSSDNWRGLFSCCNFHSCFSVSFWTSLTL
jgi:hypothetical protein